MPLPFHSQIQSLVPTGTAPLSIVSTTQVDNLNADFLDGQHGSYYLNAGNLNAGTLPADRLSGTYTISISGYAAAVVVSDTRNAATTPQTIDRGVVFDFKANTSNGLDDGGNYFGLLTFRQYGTGTDWTGGSSHQLGFTDNGNVWQRSGSNTTWGSWKKLWDDANDGAGSGLDADLLDGQHGSYYAAASSLGNYLPLSGGTLTGSVYVNTNDAIRVSWQTNDHLWIRGYGLEFGRVASYLRPGSNNGASLFVGGSTINQIDWANIDFYSSGRFNINDNPIIHAGNYTSYLNNTYLRAAGHPGYNDWNVFGNTAQTVNSIFQENFNIPTGTGSSNFPTNAAYKYGTLVNFGSGSDARAQVYISHAGNDLVFRGGWGTASWQTWNRCLTDQNYTSYALPLTGGFVSGQLAVTATTDPAILISGGASADGSAHLYTAIGGVGKVRLQRNGVIAALGLSIKSGSDVNAGTEVFSVSNAGAVTGTSASFSGDLQSGGAIIRASASTAGQAWFSTASYGVSQGDGRTHFGYYTGTQYENYIRGAHTVVNGGFQVVGAATLQSTLSVTGAITQNGQQVLHAGNFNSYALPLSGGTLTGELAISTGTSTGLRVNSPSGTQSFWIRVGYDTDGTATPVASALNTMLQSSGSSAGTFTIVCGNTKTATLSNTAANFAVALQQGGNQVLHAGNYTSYVLAASGTAASLSIGGSAVSSTTQSKSDSSTSIATTAFSKWLFATFGTGGTTDWNHVSNTMPGTGTTLLRGSDTNGFGPSQYYHPVNFEYAGTGGTGNVTQLAVAYGLEGNDLRMRGRYSGTWTSWVQFLNSSNYNSYAPTLTGTGASGTWNINISGSAAQLNGQAASFYQNAGNLNAGTLPSARLSGTYTIDIAGASSSGSRLGLWDATAYITGSNTISGTGGRGVNLAPNTYVKQISFEFKSTSFASMGGNYGGLITIAPWDGTAVSQGDPNYQLLFSASAANSTSNPVLRLRAGIDAGWGAWATLIHDANFSTAIPNSGVGAGTYNNVTVNAKGIVTGGSNVSYLTGNQSITLSGDVSGSGTTAITATIGAGAVTYAKIQNVAISSVLGNSSASVAQAPQALSMATLAGMLSGQTMNIAGSSSSCTGNAATATTATNSTQLNGQAASYYENRDTTAVSISAGTLTLTRAAGNLTATIGGRVVAWCHFDGTPPSATTLNANFNVSSVTKNGTGDYTVNFTNAIGNTTYVVAGTAQLDAPSPGQNVNNVFLAVPRRSGAQASGSCRVVCEYPSGLSLWDSVIVRVAFIAA